MEELVTFLPIVAIALLFWLLIIRPQSRRQKAVLAMQAALEPGVDVMLTSGVFGTLEHVGDDHVLLRVTDDVVLKVAKGAVGSVVEPEPTASPTHTDTQED